MAAPSTAVEKAGSALERLKQKSDLQKLDPSKLGLPRITIDGVNAVYKHSILPGTKEEFSGVICDFVTQRTMWKFPMPDKPEPPLCRSRDGETGKPNKDSFPLDEYAGPVSLKVIDDNTVLPCEGCNFAEWGEKDPKTKKSKPPACGEEHCYIVMVDWTGSGKLAPALLTAKSTSMSGSFKYLGSFQAADEMPLAYWTNFTLRPERKGQTRYAVIEFERGDRTDEADWEIYAETAISAADYLHSTRSDETPAADDSTDLPTAKKLNDGLPDEEEF